MSEARAAVLPKRRLQGRHHGAPAGAAHLGEQTGNLGGVSLATPDRGQRARARAAMKSVIGRGSAAMLASRAAA
jgi:hypothetical protein